MDIFKGMTGELLTMHAIRIVMDGFLFHGGDVNDVPKILRDCADHWEASIKKHE